MYSHMRTLCFCAEPFIFVLVRRIWIKSSIVAHILLIFNILIFWFGGILCCCLEKESFIWEVYNFLFIFIARILNCRNYDHHSTLIALCQYHNVLTIGGHYGLVDIVSCYAWHGAICVSVNQNHNALTTGTM